MSYVHEIVEAAGYDGYFLFRDCEGCGRSLKITLEWAELSMLDSLAGAPGWRSKSEAHTRTLKCPECRHSVCVRVSRPEISKQVERGRLLGYLPRSKS